MVSEDEFQHKSTSSEDQTSPTRIVSTLPLILREDCIYVTVIPCLMDTRSIQMLKLLLYFGLNLC